MSSPAQRAARERSRGATHEGARGTARTKVVYVMGAGHSGSTILGVALGNCEGVFYAGEVDEWLLKGGLGRWAGEERTRFWGAVREQLDESAQELYGEQVNSLIERSSALLRVGRSGDRARIVGRYRSFTEELFAAIADVAQASYVVDTSHFPLRARQLQQMAGVELHLIFLTRDPQAVVESNVRAISRHEVAERRLKLLSTNVGLWLTQLLSAWVFLCQPRARRVFLRYEDLVADPAGILRQVLDGVGLAAEVPDTNALRIGVPLEGNRLLSAETIAIKAPSRATARHSQLTAILQRPWRTVLDWLRPAARRSTGER